RALSRRKRRTSSAKACSAALNPNSMGPLCCQRHPVPRKCARRDFARVRIPAAARRVQECMGAFHEGERAVQARAGVAAEARGLGRGISSGIPPGAQPFLEAQRLAVLAGIDTAGHVWASLVTGNRPKYIQARAPEQGAHTRGAISRWGTTFTVEQRLAIERADTLFIASVHAARGADASHRGGQPGFVRVLDERRLRIPDYAGNN